MIFIKKISASETYNVRHAVLREGKPLESCMFKDDNHPDTAHFGAFENEVLIAVASVFKTNNPTYNLKNCAQLRGMAVLPNYRRAGYGALLLKNVENYAKAKGYENLWFNARERAVKFYRACGYSVDSKEFIIEGIGIHYIMSKKL